MIKYYKTIKEVVGSIMVADKVCGASFGELVYVVDQNGKNWAEIAQNEKK